MHNPDMFMHDRALQYVKRHQVFLIFTVVSYMDAIDTTFTIP